MVPFVFQPADILLPADVDMTRWSVIACDQFTSDQQFWKNAETIVGDAPSTLRLMLPEYYLGKCNEAEATARIQSTMCSYLEQNLFQTFYHSFIYLERTLPGGTIRRGLIGQVDLEAYDYSAGSVSPIRATEGTVEARLPARVAVRKKALLEMPHIMLFVDDPNNSLIRSAENLASETVYDFDLMLGGGHVTGRRISGADADGLAASIARETAGQTLQFAVGDGNHSLAAARKLWLEKRESLPAEQRSTDPARFALVELVNIHDPSITFEPIHRVLFGTDAARFADAAREALYEPSSGRSITLVVEGKQETLPCCGDSIGQLIERVESFCRNYMDAYGGEMDYIHGDRETVQLASAQNACGILLPKMEKAELFSSVSLTGPFPKKSFSIGLGLDKRFYLECRHL